MSNDDSATNVKLGLRLYTIGIGVQEAFIVCFLFLVFRFHWKMVVGKGLEERGDGWRKLLYIVYGTLGLITVSTFSFNSPHAYFLANCSHNIRSVSSFVSLNSQV